MSKKTKQQKHQERLEEKQKHLKEHVEQEAHMHDDDLVVAPKGMSRRKFIFTLAVTIGVVLAFVVPGAIMSSLGGSNPLDRVYMTYERPGVGKVSMTQRDFQKQELSYTRLLSLFGQNRNIEDEDVAAYILEGELATEAGIVVTDRDLGGFLREQMKWDQNTLVNAAQSLNMTAVELQEELRRWLRVGRYKSLLSKGLAFADTTEVESQWKDQFREYKLVYVEANSDAFDEDARALVPDDTELEAWFTALPQFQKNSFMTKRKMAAEFAIVKLDGSDAPAELLAKYPIDETADSEMIQRNYYDLVSAIRFQKPAPEETEEEAAPQDLTIPFEEVAEICAKEAPIYYAVHEWLTEMGPKASDPAQTIDFAAEAANVGVALTSDSIARSEEEWAEVEEDFGTRLSGMLRYAPSGHFLPTVLITSNSVVIARCSAVEEAKLPEFANMRDEVVDAWIKDKRADVGLEKLTAVYESFLESPEDKPTIGGIEVEEQVFADALSAAGFSPVEREWRDRIQPPPGGFVDAAPIELYLRQNTAIYILQEGQVSEPSLDSSREHIYMIRMVGSRDPELVSMKPAFIRNIEGTVVNQASTEFASQAFGFDAYADRFNLELIQPQPQPQ